MMHPSNRFISRFTGRLVLALALWGLLASAVASSSLAVAYEVPLSDSSRSACAPENRAALLVLEAENLLGHVLPEARRQALLAVLGGAASGLLASCEERARATLPNGQTVAAVDAVILLPQLHARLLGLGTLHTRAAPLNYTLETPLTDEGSAAATLARLELAGGMVQRAGSSVRLRILRDKNRWEAVLSGPAGVFSAASPSLDHLWSAVWGPYFMKQQAMAPVRTMTLRVWGWKDSPDLRSFEQMFKLWNTAIRAALLGEVNLNLREASAQWTLEVIDPAELANHLSRYAASRGVRYELK